MLENDSPLAAILKWKLIGNGNLRLSDEKTAQSQQQGQIEFRNMGIKGSLGLHTLLVHMFKVTPHVYRMEVTQNIMNHSTPFALFRRRLQALKFKTS